MSSIADIYMNALLADATYALDENGLHNKTGEQLTSLLEERMTPTLAKFIGDSFTVVTHIETSDAASSGFDGTVWKANSTGKLYVSMQGTAGLQDFLTDANLALTGNARSQVTSMVNWWLSISTPVGTLATQVRDVGASFVATTPVAGQGLVSASDLAAGIEVNGHSLGGYLATAFTRLFGIQANVKHTSTFNSAGFAAGSEAVFAMLEPIIGASYGLGRFPNLSEQSNFFAKNGLNLTTNSFWFSQQGKRIDLFNELDSTQVGNHYMYKLTDSLALGSALQSLDTSFTTEKLNLLLEAGSNRTESSIEGVLDALRGMLLGSDVLKTPIGDVSNSADSRKTYHDELDSLQHSNEFQLLAGTLLLKIAGPDLRAVARNDFAALVALQDLSPIYISGKDSAADAQLVSLWRATRATDYADWIADKSMSPEDRAAGKERFSDNWMVDRSAMLVWVIQANKQDNDGAIAVAPGVQGMHFDDRASGRLVDVGLPDNVVIKRQTIFGDGDADVIEGKGLADRLYGGEGDDLVDGKGGDDYIEGNAGDDQLYGGDGADTVLGGSGKDLLQGEAGADRLEGGAGEDDLRGGDGFDTLLGGADDDKLNGESGNDTLAGGDGNDTYSFEGAWGKDTITDSDDTGQILIGGQAATGGKATGKRGVWQAKDAQGNFLNYAVYDDASSSTGKKLLITKGTDSANSITVNNFDFAMATGDAGYLGIKLDGGAKLAITADRDGNFWTDPDASLDNLQGNETNIAEGTGQRFTISLNVAAKAGDTIVLALTGVSDKLKAFFGGDTVAANGATIALTEGQTEVKFSLVQEGDLDADGVAALSASYQGQDQTGVSNTWTVNLKDNGQAEQNNTLLGDQLYATQTNTGAPITRTGQTGSPVTVVDTGQQYFSTDANGNLVLDTNGTAVTDNTIFGTDQNDKIDGKGGNDLLAGGLGNDTINGGEGDDLIAGGAGSDQINGGDGDDHISSASNFANSSAGGRQQIGPDDQWTNWGLPAGKTAIAHGATWGVYPGTDATIWDGISTIDTAAAGDAIDGGAGNDDILASWASDRVKGGDGKDVISGLAGDDVLEGGDGDDYIDGDGIVKTGYLNSVDASRHGSDFIDGGAGDDELMGRGGADDIFGGVGNDHIYADASVETDSTDFVDFAYHGKDFVDAEDGDDYVEGGGRDDIIYGGAGKDVLWGDQTADRLKGAQATNPLAWGNDYIDGGAGDDQLIGGGGDDTLYGGTGNDQMSGDEPIASLDGAANGADYMDGEAGDDQMIGGGKDDTLFGGDGDDLMSGDDTTANLAGAFQGNDYLSGEAGNDQLVGGGKDDVLYGGEGNDVLVGDDSEANVAGEFHGNDLLDGGAGDDQLLGGGKDDILDGGDGADKLWGDAPQLAGAFHGADQLEGGAGDDQLVGGGKDDVLDGGDGDDLLFGDDSQDKLAGQFHGNDLLEGGAGNDQLIGGGRDDTLLGGDGNDTLLGDDVDTSLAGEFHGSDYLDGGAGDDFLVGGGGADQLYGGSGNDILQGDAALSQLAEQFNADDYLDGGEGNDTLFGGGGNDTLIGGAGNDRLNAGNGDDRLDGGAGDDVYGILGVLGTKTVIDEGGFDVFQLGWRITDTVLGRGSLLMTNTATGAQVHIEGFNVDDPDAVSPIEQFEMTDANGSPLVLSAQELIARLGFSFDGTQADDVLLGTAFGDKIRAFEGNDTVYGFAGDDVLEGGAGDDALYGGDANDVLDGGDGANMLVGGLGDDEYVLGANGLNTVVEFADEGNDTVDVSVSYVLTDPDIENVRLVGTDAINATGNDTANRLYGNSANNDLDGGAGLDTLEGGAGDDTYHVESRFDVIVEAADEGIDTVYSSDNRALSDNVENLVLEGLADFGGGNNGANRIEGTSGHNDLVGWGGDDTLLGYGGNDVLIGGRGADVLIGGQGHDFYVADRFDTIVENAAEGADGILSNASIDLSAAGFENIEDASLVNMDGPWTEYFDSADWDAYNITGNALFNILSGNSAANVILGGAGDDILAGHAGDDILDGGVGADYMRGALGDDTYYVDNEGDVVEDVFAYSDGEIIEAGGGYDRVIATASVKLGNGIEEATLLGAGDLNATGNDEANLLVGNAGANRLDGLTGVDTMAGGAGDDTYMVDDSSDQVVEAAGEGTDTVYSTADFTLGDNVENLTLLSGDYTVAQLGIGNELDNIIIGNDQAPSLLGLGGNDTLIGGRSNDSLLGGDGNDVLTDDLGADYLDGGAGDDLMAGGKDDDTYLVDSQGDTVVEQDNAGTDQVLTTLTDYTLSHGVENLYFTSEADARGTGNELNNLIVGNIGADVLLGGAGNDVLVGSAGADMMDGGTGDDTYYVDDAGDVVQEAGGDGTDMVYSSASHMTLGDGIENLQIEGEVGGAGTGNALDNNLLGDSSDNTLAGLDGNDRIEAGYGADVLVGGNGNDLLDGGSGADAMAGGVGDDVYIVDEVGDSVTELANEGVDTVVLDKVADYTMGSNIEVLDASGQRVALHGTGNALDNTIKGGKGADVLSGGAGNDVITGGGFEVLLSGDVDPASVPNYGQLIGDEDGTFGRGGAAAVEINNFLRDWNPEQGRTWDNLVAQFGVATEIAESDRDNYVVVSAGYLPLPDGQNMSTQFSVYWPRSTYPVTSQLADIAPDAADVLDGGAGDDVLDGGAGDDRLFGGDGADVLRGGADEPGLGSSHYTLYEYTREWARVSLFGTVSNNDYLDGGAGVDTMIGGSGDDTYIVDGQATPNKDGRIAALDVCDTTNRFGMDEGPALKTWVTDAVVEAAGQGNDKVIATASVVLDNIETVVLSDASAILDIDATTGAGSQTLQGNRGNNRLNGGADADVMTGGAGNDVYIVDNAADAVVELAGEGIDTVRTTADAITLADNVENLVLEGSAGLSGSGNSGDNILIGNTGNNTLEGGAGADILAGWRGDDVLRGGEGADTYVFARGDGHDVVDDAQGSSTVHFSGDIHRSDLSFQTQADDLVIYVGASDSSDGTQVVLRNWHGSMQRVDTLTFCADQQMALTEDVINQAPVAIADTAVAHEDGAAVTGNVLANDTDPNGDTLSVSNAGTQTGQYGSLNLAATGDYVYTVNNAATQVQALGAGQHVQDSFVYTVTDNAGANALTASSQLTVDVVGVNDGPVAQADTASASEDGAPVSGNVLSNDSDIDVGDSLSVTSAGTKAGAFGSLKVAADGSYAYTVNNATTAVQALAVGQHASDVFAYTVSDNHGATATSQLTVDVVGANDGPIGHADAASVSEDGVLTAGGNVLTNDSDIDAGDTLSVTNAGAKVGEYGTLNLAANGAYTYSLNNSSTKVQALAAGQQVSDVFSYTVADNHGATATAQLSVTIAGADEAQCGLTVVGTTKNDTLKGSDCADTIDGRQGADTMTGGKGDDIYFVDTFTAGSSCEPAQGDKVVELASGGNDTVAASVSYVLADNVENLMMLGSAALTATGNAKNNVIVGNAGANTLDGGDGDDVVVGRAAADVLYGGNGNDKLYGEGGADKLYGSCGDDKLWGGSGNDLIDGGGGNDLAAGGDGDDTITMGIGLDVVVAGKGVDKITTSDGNDFIDAGADNDVIDSGAGSDFIAAGRGNDSITTGTGRDVIAFNRGDGQDTIISQKEKGSSSGGDLISLGGGIKYADLTLSKAGQDLILGLGQGDQITNKDWYAKNSTRSVSAIQMITTGGDYNPTSTNPLLNKQVEVFDFNPLVDKFDAARQANSSLVTWAVQPALASALIGSSNTTAMGGDLAYRYATTYTAASPGLGSDMTVDAVRTELAGQSAATWQAFTAAPAATASGSTATSTTSTAAASTSASTATVTVDPWVALQAGTDLVVSQAAGASNPITPTTTPTTDSLVIAALGASTEPVPTWVAPR